MENIEKKCVVCSTIFTSSEIKCPKCGCGTFEVEKKNNSIKSETQNSKEVKPRTKKSWLEKIGFKRSAEETGKKSLDAQFVVNQYQRTTIPVEAVQVFRYL
jgi:predicted  nucleic acid-binding Zn-ribbon protein